MIAGVAAVGAEDLQTLADLAEAGEFCLFIDQSYPLESATEPRAYVEREGRAEMSCSQSLGLPGAMQF